MRIWRWPYARQYHAGVFIWKTNLRSRGSLRKNDRSGPRNVQESDTGVCCCVLAGAARAQHNRCLWTRKTIDDVAFGSIKASPPHSRRTSLWSSKSTKGSTKGLGSVRVLFSRRRGVRLRPSFMVLPCIAIGAFQVLQQPMKIGFSSTSRWAGLKAQAAQPPDADRRPDSRQSLGLRASPIPPRH